jgi:predicted NAD/FAD-binding protein
MFDGGHGRTTAQDVLHGGVTVDDGFVERDDDRRMLGRR